MKRKTKYTAKGYRNTDNTDDAWSKFFIGETLSIVGLQKKINYLAIRGYPDILIEKYQYLSGRYRSGEQFYLQWNEIEKRWKQGDRILSQKVLRSLQPCNLLSDFERRK